MPKSLLITALVVLGWFVLSEVGVAGWYGFSETRLTANPALPPAAALAEKLQTFLRSNGAVETNEVEVPEVSMEMLKANEGVTVNWTGGAIPNGIATIIRWGDRSNVQGVEATHNPGVCMAAAGWTVSQRLETSTADIDGNSVEIGLWEISRPGVQMRAYSGVIRRYREPADYDYKKTFWNSNRLKGVIAGRRDAPRLIILVYLPNNRSAEHTRDDLQGMLQAILAPEAKG